MSIKSPFARLLALDKSIRQGQYPINKPALPVVRSRQPPVPVEDGDVCGDEKRVEQVEENDAVVIVDELVGHSGHVSHQHDPEENAAFPRRGPGFP